jgi:nicotinamidase-related amidase
MLAIENTVLLIVDVQEKLSKVMLNREDLLANLVKVIKGAQVLGVPIILTEQNPAGLGQTIPEVKLWLPDIKPVSKFSFSCCGEETFVKQLAALKRSQVLLAGIESHICVYQTAVDLISIGHEVQVLADCVSSRTAENKALGLEKMKEAGASVTSVETALFELMRVAEGNKFKELSKIVK